MMKITGYWIIGCILFGGIACTDEKECSREVAGAEGRFKMQDVAYAFEGAEAADYKPYYNFTDRLELLAFRENHIDTSFVYDYNYCREHPVISEFLRPGSYYFLFAGNLLDHKLMNWQFMDSGILQAVFRIEDHLEPPVYLIDILRGNLWGVVDLPVQLQMIVSRLEIKVINPPEWVTGLEFSVQQIAREIRIRRNNYMQLDGLESELSDTTSVYKTTDLKYIGPGDYWVGVNTFPTYKDHPAVVDVKLKGAEKVSQFVINDNRLLFRPGQIVRMSILFETESTIRVSVEIKEKWEIIDEGRVEI